MTTNTLSPIETEELARHEDIIRAGKDAFVQVGLALMEICDRRLYREQFGSFNEYCAVRWEFSARRGQQLIAAARVVQQLAASAAPEVRNNVSQLNARSAAALAQVPPEQRTQTLNTVAAQGKVTAAAIKKVSQPLLPTLPPSEFYKRTILPVGPVKLSPAAQELLEALELDMINDDNLINNLVTGQYDPETIESVANHRIRVARLLTKFKKELCGVAVAA